MGSSSKSHGGEGSSSNPNPPNPNPNPNPATEESPRRSSGGENVTHSSPQGHGSPSSTPRTSGMTTPPRMPPSMGVPGQSAFTPYSRPVRAQSISPPPGFERLPSGSGGAGFFGGAGFQGAQAVPVGSIGASSGALRIGGSAAARKRVREGGPAGNQPGEGGANPNPVSCSVCQKVFMSPKALFGHMRSHPDRGWKGAHPPPVFRAEEEFADLRVGHPEAAAAGTGGGGEAGGADEVEATERAVVEEAEEENYRLPDLNNPPPEDSN